MDAETKNFFFIAISFIVGIYSYKMIWEWLERINPDFTVRQQLSGAWFIWAVAIIGIMGVIAGFAFLLLCDFFKW